MFPQLPEELSNKIVSSASDCRTVVQLCTAVKKSGCDDAVWADAARKLDKAARNVYRDYTDKPNTDTVWSSERIRYPSPMTRTDFVTLCKFATKRTQFLAHLRRLREWMEASGWAEIHAKNVRIPIACVAFEFHNLRRMNANGVRVSLRLYEDGGVGLNYRRGTLDQSMKEEWGLWYPVDSDERLFTVYSYNMAKAVENFARSPHLKGEAMWHGQTRTWWVIVKPPS